MNNSLVKKYFVHKNGNLYCKLTKRKVGHLNSAGYLVTKFLGKIVQVHNLIWIIENGSIPKDMVVDHINRIPKDNRISNLRLVNYSGNAQNRAKPKNNTSGHKGVSWHKGHNKWQARIGLNKKSIFLGLFETKAKAVEARKKAEADYEFLTNKVCRN